MRRFFIDTGEIDEKTTVTLSGSNAHHLKDVLRLKPGDDILLFDGKGLQCEARVQTILPERVKVEVQRRLPPTNESRLHITLAQGFLKDRKMDDLVRQVTELGVCRWAPFTARRSIPRPKAPRLDARMKRWNKISREALKQCRRSVVANITRLLTFDEVLDLSEGIELKILFWENAATPLRPSAFPELPQPPQTIRALVILGPEGGLTDEEVARAEARGFVTAALGPRILKADTATVAACTIVQYLFGDLGQKILDKPPTLE